MDPLNGIATNVIVRTHSDSQQSLDRLFNSPNSQSSVPLRNRNLPASFFDPSWQTRRDSELSAHQQQRNPASLHSRSTSFQPNRNSTASHMHSTIHMRTQSTLAPMTGLVGSPASSTNGSINSVHNASTNGNPTANGPGHAISTAQQQQLPAPAVPAQVAQTIPPVPQPRGHYRNFSSPVFVNNNNGIAFSQANHLYATPTVHNTLINSQTADNIKPQGLYYSMETVPPDSTMIGPSYSQPSVPSQYETTQLSASQDYFPSEQSHARPTQPTFGPVTGSSESMDSGTNSITSITDASADGNTIMNWSGPTVPFAQQPLPTTMAPNRDTQAIPPVPQPRNDHYRNYSSPAFVINNNSNNNITISQANQFYAAPNLNTPMDSQNGDVKPHNLYYETVPPDNAITDTNYTLNSAWLAG